MTSKIIRLSGGEDCYVDDIDYGYINNWGWYLSHYGYAARSVWPGKVVYMHRVILERVGCLSTTTDHKDQDRLNNRRRNLRPATKSENGRNRGVQKNNTSGHKGVSWYKRYNCWRSRIKLNRVEYHLGYFDTAEAAAEAYNKAALEKHGDFFFLNKVGNETDSNTR